METYAAAAEATDPIEAVYRLDADRLWRSLYLFSADADVASDAVAESFAQAIRRGSAIRDPRAWVWRSAFRIAAGDLKRRARWISDQVPETPYDDTSVDSDLLAAVARLPERQRAVIVLHYYADAPVREIAHRTGMSQLAVRAHLSRGRKRLRELLGDGNG